MGGPGSSRTPHLFSTRLCPSAPSAACAQGARQMVPFPAWGIPFAFQVRPRPSRQRRLPSRHSALVRVTHWITTLCFLALLVSGIEILISHPRFYWGETGNVLTPALFKLPIPASRAIGADRLRIRAAGPERLEPLSSLSVGLGGGFDRAAVCSLRPCSRGHFRKNLAARQALISRGARSQRDRKPFALRAAE